MLRRSSATETGEERHRGEIMSAENDNGKRHDAKRRHLLKIGGAVGVSGAVSGTVVLTTLFPSQGHTRSKHHRTPPQNDTGQVAHEVRGRTADPRHAHREGD